MENLPGYFVLPEPLHNLGLDGHLQLLELLLVHLLVGGHVFATSDQLGHPLNTVQLQH